jgi:hypothetical protein
MIEAVRIPRFRSPGSTRGRHDRGNGLRGVLRRPIAILVSSAALLAFASGAETQAMRCGSRLISPGDPAAKLRQYCGEPESVSSRLEQRGVFVHGRYFPGFVEEVVVEDWIYNFGPNKLMRQVRVVDGIVREIALLGYGYDRSP